MHENRVAKNGVESSAATKAISSLVFDENMPKFYEFQIATFAKSNFREKKWKVNTKKWGEMQTGHKNTLECVCVFCFARLERRQI